MSKNANNAIYIENVDEMARHTQNLKQQVSDLLDEFKLINSDVNELEDIGVNLDSKKVPMAEVVRRLTEADALCDQAVLQMRQMVEDVKSVTEANFTL